MAEATETDIFEQQKKTIDTLINVLDKQGSAQPQQIVYSQPAAAEPTASPPNYMLYVAAAGIVVVLIVLLKKK